MNTVSLKKIKGIKVYFSEANEPWGELEDVMFDQKRNKVLAFLAKTLSIVPICKVIDKNSIQVLNEEKMVLKESAELLNLGDFKSNSKDAIGLSTIKTAVRPEWGRKKLKDIRFDFETGEMCDVVVSKNIIAGDTEVFINKISLKDNTIYVED